MKVNPVSLAISLASLCCVGDAVPTSSEPTASVRNGTYVCSLNDTWEGAREAKEYSEICVDMEYTDSIWYPQGEAGLTLNVIRDSSVDAGLNLPVGVWIHGAGFVQGSGADQRYNMSAIVANSHRIGKSYALVIAPRLLTYLGKPFIGVSINYRLPTTWGFLGSKEITESGNTKLEHRGVWRGDPSKVAVFGESAGGMSVGAQMIAYGGRDDGLFRAAIMQSGGSVTVSPMNTTAYQGRYDEIVGKVGCRAADDILQCLREVPFETPAYGFSPAVDHDLIRERGSNQLDKHEFVKVPIIAGTNTNEGASFGPTGINTTEQFHRYLTNGDSGFKLPPPITREILGLYPDDPPQGIPAFLASQRIPAKGYQWCHTSAYANDYSMHANRRRQCEAWAEASIVAYCYRFNMRSGNTDYHSGAAHLEEVAFVFNSIAGLGYHYGLPFEGMPESYTRLSALMARKWAAFIHDLDPNSAVDADVYWEGYGVNQPILDRWGRVVFAGPSLPA
ncbi:Alpha/Beta hydrolase protein [Aspergillus insuetus]